LDAARDRVKEAIARSRSRHARLALSRSPGSGFPVPVSAARRVGACARRGEGLEIESVDEPENAADHDEEQQDGHDRRGVVDGGGNAGEREAYHEEAVEASDDPFAGAHWADGTGRDAWAACICCKAYGAWR
jgi:hypothetical protein